uniref:F-actin-capping protein subunit beta n=1 Tax=Xenopus tropicalis TaxID=8364 RepID=A4IHT8_XENTR|nr:capzb protein [Xenopus tropicalis]
MTEQQLDCALDLMRRLPPQQIEKNLSDLIDLVPSLCEDLLSSVDQPLKIARDKVVGKDYLLCDYNRDGDSYRSPWSNKYDPPPRTPPLISYMVSPTSSRPRFLFSLFQSFCITYIVRRHWRVSLLLNNELYESFTVWGSFISPPPPPIVF